MRCYNAPQLARGARQRNTVLRSEAADAINRTPRRTCGSHRDTCRGRGRFGRLIPVASCAARVWARALDRLRRHRTLPASGPSRELHPAEPVQAPRSSRVRHVCRRSVHRQLRGGGATGRAPQRRRKDGGHPDALSRDAGTARTRILGCQVGRPAGDARRDRSIHRDSHRQVRTHRRIQTVRGAGLSTDDRRVTIEAPCLRLDRVSRHFGGLKAVDEVNLAIAPGARHAVIGPNGPGKTTLFNVISGELPATSGTISLSGTEITKMAPYQRAARGVSRTFQITRLFPDLTVMENLLLACTALDRRRFAWFRSLSSHDDLVDHATSLLGRFELSSLADTRARHLSYGDQRRLEVAISLAGRPRLLLLDEPMAGLSTPERVSMRRLLETLDPTIAVLLIEHDMDMAFAFAERVTVLHQGRVMAEGSRDEVGADKMVQAIYLGSAGRVPTLGLAER